MLESIVILQDAANAGNILAHYGLKRRWETRFAMSF